MTRVAAPALPTSARPGPALRDRDLRDRDLRDRDLRDRDPDRPPGPPGWPRPPAALPAGWLDRPSEGARVTVAGLVLCRQRPGTARGVIFLTLEDETGTCNVVVWAKVYERFRRAVIAGRLLRVTGRLQRQAGVVHVVAERIEDVSALLDRLLQPGFAADGTRAADQP